MKLGWDVPWEDLYHSCSKNYDISKNMAIRGGASFPNTPLYHKDYFAMVFVTLLSGELYRTIMVLLFS